MARTKATTPKATRAATTEGRRTRTRRAPAKIDLTQYRPNVGVALFSPDGHVLVGRRHGERGDYCWQMPQGGVDEGETVDHAALRELAEETGVPAEKVEPLEGIDEWLTYDFPPEVRERKRAKGRADWTGQKQRWFAFRFVGSDRDVRLDLHDPPEFDAWRWERLERTPELVIPWKRPVYLVVARTFAKFAAG